MPGPLKNPKREAFALECAAMAKSGKTLDECYVSAGYKSGPKNAQRLRGKEGIRSRIEEIQRPAAQKVSASIDRWVQEVVAIATSDLRKAVEWNGNLVEIHERSGPEDEGAEVVKHISNNRVRLIDSNKLDDATAAAISEVSQGADGSIKIKMHAKAPALEMLGKFLRAYVGDVVPPPSSVTNNFNITAEKLALFASYSPLERARRLLFSIELAAREQEKIDAAGAAVTIEG